MKAPLWIMCPKADIYNENIGHGFSLPLGEFYICFVLSTPCNMLVWLPNYTLQAC